MSNKMVKSDFKNEIKKSWWMFLFFYDYIAVIDAFIDSNILDNWIILVSVTRNDF